MSFKWTKKAAQNGYIAAMNNLGIAYADGVGVKQDASQAVAWYQKAALAGDQTAMFNVGLHYFYGSGVVQNYQKATYWFKKASFRDEPHAQFMLAKMYLTGAGVKQDRATGMNWLTLVAYRYYDPYFEVDLQKRNQSIRAFIQYQVAEFLGTQPNYEKGTTPKMIKTAKALSKIIEKDCSVNG